MKIKLFTTFLTPFNTGSKPQFKIFKNQNHFFFNNDVLEPELQKLKVTSLFHVYSQQET